MKNSRFILWDKSNWERGLNFIEKHKSQEFEGKNVLELGGGEGSLSLWASHNGANVICSDIINPGSIALNKLYQEKVEFQIIDAQDIPYRDHFDFVIFKSLLGGVSRNNIHKKQTLVMEQIKKSLKRGGECLFIENMEGTIFHQIYRKIYGAGKNRWNYPSLNNFENLSKKFSHTQYRSFGLLGSTHRSGKLFRKVFDKKFDHLFPNSWHYIYAGIYQK